MNSSHLHKSTIRIPFRFLSFDLRVMSAFFQLASLEFLFCLSRSSSIDEGASSSLDCITHSSALQHLHLSTVSSFSKGLASYFSFVLDSHSCFWFASAFTRTLSLVVGIFDHAMPYVTAYYYCTPSYFVISFPQSRNILAPILNKFYFGSCRGNVNASWFVIGPPSFHYWTSWTREFRLSWSIFFLHVSSFLPIYYSTLQKWRRRYDS